MLDWMMKAGKGALVGCLLSMVTLAAGCRAAGSAGSMAEPSTTTGTLHLRFISSDYGYQPLLPAGISSRGRLLRVMPSAEPPDERFIGKMVAVHKGGKTIYATSYGVNRTVFLDGVNQVVDRRLSGDELRRELAWVVVPEGWEREMNDIQAQELLIFSFPPELINSRPRPDEKPVAVTFKRY